MTQKKTCRKCNEEKPVTEFYKLKQGRYGVTTQCKDCMKKKHNEYYANNREKHLKRTRISAVKRKYGLTKEEFENLVYVCSICEATEGRMVIDHSHTTGKFRGVLCSNCNTGIGLLQDSSDVLFKAYKYLLNYESEENNNGTEENN